MISLGGVVRARWACLLLIPILWWFVWQAFWFVRMVIGDIVMALGQ